MSEVNLELITHDAISEAAGMGATYEDSAMAEETYFSALRAIQDKLKSSILKLVLETRPPDRTHSIEHGGLIHPYETPEEEIYNTALIEWEKNINQLFE